jgi:hypothetical protein
LFVLGLGFGSKVNENRGKQRKAIVDEEVRLARRAIEIKAQFTEQEKKQLKETGDATKELAESRGGNYDKEFDALNKARLKAIALEDESTVNLEKTYSRRDKIEADATVDVLQFASLTATPSVRTRT